MRNTSATGTPQPRFQRRREDFICEKCGKAVAGSGYTNHCPFCLWSRHVDVNPGDRMAECGGLMEPMAAEYKNGTFRILSRCTKCGIRKRNQAQEADSTELLLKLAAQS